MIRFGLRRTLLTILCCSLASATVGGAEPDKSAATPKDSVSFYREVRPVLQRHCAGCHHPGKPEGKLQLTAFSLLKKGGENGPLFVAGRPDKSLLIQYVSGEKPMMPLNGDPLTPKQLSTLNRWIAAGALDDTPAAVEDTVSAEKPPVYQAPPVITAVSYSPDGKLLAVSGFHEILLVKTDGSGLAGRLIGRSQRIESIAFSPDGKLIGATGGTPSLFGEVQIWDVATQKLKLSQTLATDVLLGGSFSDDGKLFACGGADNRARVIQVADGKQIMRFDAHSDWVLGTTFSLKNDHLITVSRDMSMKLVILQNAQFVDNITSITPGALKGGLAVVQRHPKQEAVLTGGSDGEPKLYKIFRTQTRVIGDDFNRIRGYAVVPGRIFSMQFQGDGNRFVVGGSNATSGSARIYDTEAGTQLHDLAGIQGPVFAVAFRADGSEVAVGGFSGKLRLYDAKTGKLTREIIPVPLTAATAAR